MEKVLLAISLLLIAMPANSANSTVAKDRKPGTTSDAGNRCPGDNFNSCLQATIRIGWKPAQAARHCTRACRK